MIEQDCVCVRIQLSSLPSRTHELGHQTQHAWHFKEEAICWRQAPHLDYPDPCIEVCPESQPCRLDFNIQLHSCPSKGMYEFYLVLGTSFSSCRMRVCLQTRIHTLAKGFSTSSHLCWKVVNPEVGNCSAVKACNYKSLHSQPCYGRYYNCISQTVVLMEVARGCTSPKRPRRGSQVDGCVEKRCLSHCSSHQLLFKLRRRWFCDLSFAVSSLHQWTLDIFRRIRFGYSPHLLFLTCSTQKKGSICSWCELSVV